MILPLQAIVGFFPNPERKGNIHYFSDNELEVLRIIECLKKRKELFEARKSAVETEIQELQKNSLPFKIQMLVLWNSNERW